VIRLGSDQLEQADVQFLSCHRLVALPGLAFAAHEATIQMALAAALLQMN
jgi:hypothetical protein